MKYLDEYRDADLAKALLNEIHDEVSRSWVIMEICGGQTHSLVRNGLIDLLPPKIEMIHGPGCPVCVTPMVLIDQAIELAMRPEVILTTFGDMMRVPGTERSLLSAKAEGADVRMVYSPLEAVELAKREKNREVVFFAVGFETTAPANAISVLQAQAEGIGNFSLLSSHVLVPPAMEAILSDPENRVQAFLAAGHVCTIMGMREYHPISEKYAIPIIATGFEPVDLLKGIHEAVQMLENGEWGVKNAYERVVREEGNPEAQSVLEKVFRTDSRAWRGMGVIPESGYHLREEMKHFDAQHKFELRSKSSEKSNGCISGDILKGAKKPMECPFFGTSCDPEHPMGAPMVSSEGACAAYYHFKQETI
jgi:hydrogenase expression/formation protein HypD